MKRKVAILSGLLLTAVAGFTGNLFGDANGDGRVDMADVVAVVNAVMDNAPDNFDEAMADINGNGKIDEEDACLLAESLFNPPFDPSNALVDDYERAFTQGYLPMKYSARYRKQQITSQEFKAMLKSLIEKYCPDKMDFFNTNITDYDTLITRGIATIMAYYTAQCIGVNTRNRAELVQGAREFPEDMWDNWEHVEEYELALPHATDVELTEVVDGQTITTDTWMMAWGWNDEHWSYYSYKEIVARDEEAVSYHWDKPFIWEDAIRAVTRLYDSFKKEIEYISIDDPRATTPDADIITPQLIAKAAEKDIHNIEDLQWQFGFQTGTGNFGTTLPTQFNRSGKDIKEWSDWGFNSLLFGISYRDLFTTDLQVNLDMFRSLDEIIAAAMETGFFINLSMAALPGCGMYLPDDNTQDYIIDGDLDNPEKRQKACDVWQVIATRYKDVPNINLGFTVITEIGAQNAPDGFGESQAFTWQQIFDYQDVLIEAIREVSPERFIFIDWNVEEMPYDGKWHPTAQLHTDHFSKYTNICPMLNWMEMAIAFYEYNDGDGNIDFAHHSVWVPTYPITLYDGNRCVHDDHIVLIDGCLPKGTTIDFYISDAGSETSINISVDGTTKVEETFEESHDFNMGFAMAYGEQFRKSDKKYSISLEETANEITMSAPKGVFNWCGIEVKLPEEYTVERWRKDSDWDYQLGWIAEEDFHIGEFYMKPTSSVLIGALLLDWDVAEGFHFTIHDDVTFTSDHIYSQSNKEHIESLFKAISEKYPLWAVRTEDILVTDMDGALRFWDDATDIIKKYKGHLWGSEITLLSREELAPYRIAGYEGENYKGHHDFNVKLLEVLQKYMDK